MLEWETKKANKNKSLSQWNIKQKRFRAKAMKKSYENKCQEDTLHW